MVVPGNTQNRRRCRSGPVHNFERGKRYTETNVAEEQRDVGFEMCDEAAGVDVVRCRRVEGDTGGCAGSGLYG